MHSLSQSVQPCPKVSNNTSGRHKRKFSSVPEIVNYFKSKHLVSKGLSVGKHDEEFSRSCPATIGTASSQKEGNHLDIESSLRKYNVKPGLNILPEGSNMFLPSSSESRQKSLKVSNNQSGSHKRTFSSVPDIVNYFKSKHLVSKSSSGKGIVGKHDKEGVTTTEIFSSSCPVTIGTASSQKEGNHLAIESNLRKYNVKPGLDILPEGSNTFLSSSSESRQTKVLTDISQRLNFKDSNKEINVLVSYSSKKGKSHKDEVTSLKTISDAAIKCSKTQSLITDFLHNSKRYSIMNASAFPSLNKKTDEIENYSSTSQSSDVPTSVLTNFPSVAFAQNSGLDKISCSLNWEQRLKEGIDNITTDNTLIYCASSSDVEEVSGKQQKRVILARIEEILNRIKETRSITVRSRSHQNCDFINDRLVMKPFGAAKNSTITLNKKTSLIKFQLIVNILEKTKILLTTGSYCTKRELYYQLVNIASRQYMVDEAIDCISCILDVGPWEWGVLPTSKGLVYGSMQIFYSDEQVINCNVAGGTLIPQVISKITKIVTNARFILIVEKDSVFQKLLDDDVPNKLPRSFIMITGKGYPDTNTRLFLKKLCLTLAIPAFILVDADPHGIDIFLTYKYGSANQAHLSHQLALPSLKWLGVFPSEIGLYNLQSSQLNQRERIKIKAMLRRPYLFAVPRVKKELELLDQKGLKAEIEGLLKAHNYITKVYLPHKFSNKDFI